MTSEQQKALKQLSPPNRKIILKMQRHLETYYINELDYEQTISDIIGMALEYEERGESFSDGIGDCAVFCRELVNNLPLQSKGERTFDLIRWVLCCVGVFVPVIWLLSFLSYMPSSSKSVLLFAPLGFLMRYLVFTMVMVFGLFYVKRNVYHSQSLVWSLYFIIILLTCLAVNFVPEGMLPDKILRINIIIWTVCFAIAVIAASLVKRLIAKKYAKKKCNK